MYPVSQLQTPWTIVPAASSRSGEAQAGCDERRLMLEAAPLTAAVKSHLVFPPVTSPDPNAQEPTFSVRLPGYIVRAVERYVHCISDIKLQPDCALEHRPWPAYQPRSKVGPQQTSMKTSQPRMRYLLHCRCCRRRSQCCLGREGLAAVST